MSSSIKNLKNATLWVKDPVADPEGEYEERHKRILKIESDIRMNRFEAAMTGSFAARSRFVDIHNKTFRSDDYSFTGEKFVSTNSNINLSEFPLSSNPTWHVNSGNSSNIEFINDNRRLIENTHSEILDLIQHTIEVNADTTLEVGLIIDLDFLVSCNPELELVGYQNVRDTEKDSWLSGRHIITGIIHSYDEGYTQTIKVKKDAR